MTLEVRRTNPDGIDYGWVMQVTFLLTILGGVPVVVALSTLVSLPTWSDRVVFVIQIGAPVWLLTSIFVYLYERKQVTREESTS